MLLSTITVKISRAEAGMLHSRVTRKTPDHGGLQMQDVAKRCQLSFQLMQCYFLPKSRANFPKRPSMNAPSNLKLRCCVIAQLRSLICGLIVIRRKPNSDLYSLPDSSVVRLPNP